MRTRLSVIIASYNSSSTIRRALDSLLAQEGRAESFALEIIVVDDCSTDDTRAIVATYSQVTLLVNERNSGGPNRGRNLGLERCTGDVIAIADHDDEWLPNRALRQLPLLEKFPVVSCGYTVVDETTGKEQVRAKSCEAGHATFAQFETFFARLERRPGGQTTYLGTLMFRRELLDIRFEEVYGAVDYDYVARLFQGRSSAEVCAPLYRRYVDGSNLSLNETYRLRDHAHSLDYLEGLRAHYPEAVQTGTQRVNGSLARYYYVVDQMSEARRYFLKAGLSPKHVLYFLTTFAGAKWVRRRFNVFG